MRYFMELAYKGTNYSGWQVQENAMTIQGEIEKALKTLLKDTIRITGAGRTDTGVHASYYVAHLDTGKSNMLNENGFLKSINAILPNDIVIYSLNAVAEQAHARFSALTRTYQYYLTDEKTPFLQDFTCRVYKKPDINQMNDCAQELLNTTDFSAFAKLHSQTGTNLCKVFHANWNHTENLYVFTIKADRFLRNMVRAIVGTLMDVGNNKITREQFVNIINDKNRSLAGASAPPKGLFLVDIEYPGNIFLKKKYNHFPFLKELDGIKNT